MIPPNICLSYAPLHPWEWDNLVLIPITNQSHRKLTKLVMQNIIYFFVDPEHFTLKVI